MSSRARPVHLGTRLDTRGGISSVVLVYQRCGFFEKWGVHHVATHTDRGGLIVKLMVAARAWLTVLVLWLTGRIAVLHVHTASGPSFWRKLIISMPVLLGSTPLIVHVHGGGFEAVYKRSGRVAQWLIRMVLERSDLVVALTEEWLRALRAIAPTARVEVLVNPVELPSADSLPPDGAQRDTVLFLGLLHRQKGAHDLVQAFAKLPESATQLRLVLAGVGDVDELRTLARRQGVGDRVDFPGWVGPEEKARWLHRAACLVLPSYAEGLPIAALEAMAFAVPVIAS